MNTITTFVKEPSDGSVIRKNYISLPGNLSQDFWKKDRELASLFGEGIIEGYRIEARINGELIKTLSCKL